MEQKKIENSSLNKQAWLRYFARTIDMLIGTLFIGLIFGIAFGIITSILGYSQNFLLEIPDLILTIFLIAIYFFIEASIISKFGTTPAKKLFGITLFDSSGEKLDYKTSLQRGFILWFKGLALSIPLISLITLGIAYNTYTDEGKTSWDKTLNVIVLHQKISTIRFIIGIIIWLIAFALNIAMITV